VQGREKKNGGVPVILAEGRGIGLGERKLRRERRELSIRCMKDGEGESRRTRGSVNFESGREEGGSVGFWWETVGWRSGQNIGR